MGNFQEKSPWLYHYLIKNLNTKLFHATARIRYNNGFQVLCVMDEELDNIPDKAQR